MSTLTGDDVKLSETIPENLLDSLAAIPDKIDPAVSTPTLQDLAYRVDKLEKQMAKLAGGLGSIANETAARPPTSIEQILHGGKKSTKRRKGKAKAGTSRKSNRK
jgi:hypothetical protein